MDKEENYIDYSVGVHKSLLQKKQMFGIGESAFYVILFITVILMGLISFYFIFLGILALFVCRLICKNEPLLLDFLFENLDQSDIYEA